MNIAKRNRLALAVVLTCMVSVNVTAQVQSNFAIHGSFNHMAVVPSKVYLIYSPLFPQPTDSAAVINGQYEFRGYTEDALGIRLSLKLKPDPLNASDQVSIILDKGELNVVSSGSFANIEVSGSGSQAQLDFVGIQRKSDAEMTKLNISMASDSFKNDPEFKKRLEQWSVHSSMSRINDYLLFVRHNPGSRVAPYLTYLMVAVNILTPAMSDTVIRSLIHINEPTKLNRALLSVLVEQKKRQEQAAVTNKALDDTMPAVGNEAPDFTQFDPDGKAVSLSSFKGKYVLVDFWASWCAPCRAENPNIVKAYHAYKGKGFTVLGVSLDGKATKAAWLAAINKDGLTWMQVSDLTGWNNGAAKLYGVHAIPQNFLIDPNGQIIGKNLRGNELNRKLAFIFNGSSNTKQN